MYKLLIAVPATDTSLKSYIDSQIESIVISFPLLEIEHVNEDNEIYNKYISKPNRFPAFIVFERGVRKEEFLGKVETEQLLNWLTKLLVD